MATSGNENQLLKGVSRSFYLSLRLLPKPMRGAASLAYLLARTSDTIADSALAPWEMRLECLARIGEKISGNTGGSVVWPHAIFEGTKDFRERDLLGKTAELLDWLGRLPGGEGSLVRQVLATILSGQRMDLEIFAEAIEKEPVALESEEALEDYAWRVAGCVGEFWTRLGFLTLGEKFSREKEEVLLEWGISYGKGLQLVNILRDLPGDLEMGRCYLPVKDPLNREELLGAHRIWLERALEWVGKGFSYAESLRLRRLRAASALPAMIAVPTLERMRGADWATLQKRVKVPRRAVYAALLRAFIGKI